MTFLDQYGKWLEFQSNIDILRGKQYTEKLCLPRATH